MVSVCRPLSYIPVARGGSDGEARAPRGRFKKGWRGGPGKSPVSTQSISVKAPLYKVF